MSSPLNFNQLYYFWVVAQEGSVTGAARRLHVSQPAISIQIKRLEEDFGEVLFARSGRSQVLTSFGKTTYDYAQRIFALGRELTQFAQGHRPDRSIRLAVGFGDTLPKVLVSKLLLPVFRSLPGVVVSLRQDRWDRLMGALAAHELELVLGDQPVQSHLDVKARNTLIAESPIVFYAATQIAAPLRRRFPQSLQQAPCILPPKETSLRRAVEQWFEDHRLTVNCIAEVDDSAMTKALGHLGVGVFPAPASIEDDLVDRYGVRRIGEAEGLKERVFAISRPQRIEHPGIAALLNAATAERSGKTTSATRRGGRRHNI